jgi:hypothetical protein
MTGNGPVVVAGNPSAGGPGMVGGGAGMMGATGYTASRLTCAAPTSLAGSTVNVTLGDMGMTRMMGGVAPMGGHMMLLATPATVPGGQVSLVVSNMGGGHMNWSSYRWRMVQPQVSGFPARTARSTRPAVSEKSPTVARPVPVTGSPPARSDGPP